MTVRIFRAGNDCFGSYRTPEGKAKRILIAPEHLGLPPGSFVPRDQATRFLESFVEKQKALADRIPNPSKWPSLRDLVARELAKLSTTSKSKRDALENILERVTPAGEAVLLTPVNELNALHYKTLDDAFIGPAISKATWWRRIDKILLAAVRRGQAPAGTILPSAVLAIPSISAPRKQPKTVEPYSKEELFTRFASSESVREHWLMKIQLYTGLSQPQLAPLRPNDVDFGNNTLFGVHPFPEALAPTLREWIYHGAMYFSAVKTRLNLHRARMTTLSFLVDLGASLAEIEPWLGSGIGVKKAYLALTKTRKVSVERLVRSPNWPDLGA